MASKVNTKFVIILVGALLALAVGVGGLAAITLRMSGERNVASGDRLVAEAEQALAAGDAARANELFSDAASQYGRAVNKDGTRRDWLEVWRDTLLRTTPDTDVEYGKQYRERYLGSLDRLATIDPSDPGPQLELVLTQEEFMRANSGPNPLAQVATLIDRRVASLPDDSPTAIRLKAIRGLAVTDRSAMENIDSEKREEARQDMLAFYEAFESDREPFLKPLSPGADEADAAEFAETAREDFDRVAVGLVRWHLNERMTAMTEGRAQAAADELSKAGEQLARLMNGDFGFDRSPRFLALKLEIEMMRVDQQTTNPAERVRQANALSDRIGTEILEVFESIPAAEYSTTQLVGLASWASRSPEHTERVRSLVERAIAHDSTSPLRLRAAGEAMRRLGERQRALEIYDRLRALPKPQLSLEGLILPDLKVDAAYAQVNINLDLRAEAIADGRDDDASGYLRAARSARDALEQEGGIATKALRLRAEADIARAEGERLTAIRLLEEIRREFGESTDVLSDLATLHLREGTTGEAKQILERLVSNGSINNQGVIMLADIYRREGNLNQAMQLLVDQSRRSVSPEELAEPIQQMRRLIAIESGEESDDPILAAAVRANEAIARRDYEQASAILDSIEQSHAQAASDDRIVMLRAQIDVLTGNRERARQRLSEAIGASPGNTVLERMLAQLNSEDPVADRLAEIESSSRPDVEKALARFSILASVGRTEEAMRALDEAERIDANHPTVLDVRFGMAISENDLDAAAQVAGRAAESNADGVDGLLYQGRLQMARGSLTEAVRTLRTAVGMIPSSVQIRRYLGQALAQSGQIDEGIEYLRQAYEARRDNIQVLSDYVQVLRSTGRTEEARAVLDPDNDPNAPARTNRSVTNLWLTLESQTGNIQRALGERRTYFNADRQSSAFEDSSESRENALSLMEILVNRGEIDDAEAVYQAISPWLSAGQRTRAEAGIALGRAAALDDPEAVAAAEAEAISEYRSRAAAQATDSGSPQPLVEVADFAFASGRFDLGIEIMEQAIELESSDTKQVSRVLAQRLSQRAAQLENEARALESQADLIGATDQLQSEAIRERGAQSRGRATTIRERAAEVYESILSATNAADQDLALSLAELRLQLGQLDRASELIGRIRGQQPNSLNALLLAAMLAEQRGNIAQAGQLYDEAVEKHPTNFLPFYRRAMFRSDDASRRADVLFDLRRVGELRPSLAEAWILRYRVHMQSNDPDRAFEALREGIEAVPSNADPLSRQLVQELNRFGRFAEAASVAATRARANPSDAYWQYTAGVLARQRGSMGEAADFFAQLMSVPGVENNPSQMAQVASLRLDALLRSGRSIDPAQLNRLISLVESGQSDGSEAVSRTMLLARAYAAPGGDQSRVGPLVQRGYTIASGAGEGVSTQLLRQWFADLITVVGGTQAAFNYITSLDQAIREQKSQDPNADIPHPLYIRSLTIQARQARGDSPSDLIAEAQALLAEAQNDPVARFELHKMLSNLEYADGDIEAAAREGLAALEINGQDLEMLNNVAFYLAKSLDRVDEALPLAQRAAQMAPENSDVLDTVGVVYMLSGDYSRAVNTLQLALRFARTQEQRLPANLHLAETLLLAEDGGNARQYLEAAERLLPVVNESTRSVYAPEVSRVRDRLNNQ